MIGLIWAQADDGVIGNAGGIPWRLPEDQAHFKKLTMGATVLMGRKTWASLPASVRPLVGRRNLVLTTQPNWWADGAERVRSLDEAIAIVEGDLWVIGGSALYAASLPVADRAVITSIDARFAGDTFAPSLGTSWQLVDLDPETGWRTSSTGLRYKVMTYERTAAIPSTP